MNQEEYDWNVRALRMRLESLGCLLDSAIAYGWPKERETAIREEIGEVQQILKDLPRPPITIHDTSADDAAYSKLIDGINRRAKSESRFMLGLKLVGLVAACIVVILIVVGIQNCGATA